MKENSLQSREQPSAVDFINEIFLSELNEEAAGCYIFRGQACADWELNSSAIRRLNNNNANMEEEYLANTIVEYHRSELIEPARKKGFGTEDGRIISDLELLGKLQHYGAATGLTDFTRDAFTALWFSTNKYLSCDGKIFFIDLRNQMLFKQLSDESSIDDLFSEESNGQGLLYWEPSLHSEHSARILRQQSIFVLGNPTFPKELFDEVTIPKEQKEGIAQFLTTVGTDELTIYSDIYGFSSANCQSLRIRSHGDVDRFYRFSRDYYKEGKFKKAIFYSMRCIELRKDVAELYFLRGNAHARMKNYEDAIKDYLDAEDCSSSHLYSPHLSTGIAEYDVSTWGLKYNRAIVYMSIGDNENALACYNKAIGYDNLPPTYLAMSHFNRANIYAYIDNHESAISDYNTAILYSDDANLRSHAYFNKANSFLKTGLLGEASRFYRMSEEESAGEFADATRNLRASEAVLKLGIKDHGYRLIQPYSSRHRHSFIGNVENKEVYDGNLYDGTGYDRGPSFSIKRLTATLEPLI